VRSTGVFHVDLVVSDIDRALRFYRGVFGPLGWHGVHEVPGERGETIHYVHGPGSTIGLRQAPDGGATLPVDRYRVGMHHMCLEAATEEQLYAAAERIVALGGTISEGPRHFPEYREGYHAIYFFDPDGIKLELCWTPPGTYDWQQNPPTG
jgi:glyoxylase I family protein